MHIPQTVLLVNTGAGKNLGDRAILLNVARRLRDRLPDARIIVSADTPDFMVKEFHLATAPTLMHCWGRIGSMRFLPRALRRPILGFCRLAWTVAIAATALLGRHLKTLVRLRAMEARFAATLLEADVIHLCGGGYLTDQGRDECRSVLYTGWMGLILGKPVILTGQGLGPFTSPVTRFLLRGLVRRARFLGLRDDGEGLRQIGALDDAPGKTATSADDATSLPRKTVHPVRGHLLGICLRTSPFHASAKAERFQSEWMRFVLVMEEKGWNIRFLVFHENPAFERDRYEETIDRNGLKRASICVEADPRELRARLAECRLAVGNTFHFVLFALSEGIPALALWDGAYYGNKMGSLLRQYGRAGWALNSNDFQVEQAITWASALDLESERRFLLERARALTQANDTALTRAYDLALDRINAVPGRKALKT